MVVLHVQYGSHALGMNMEMSVLLPAKPSSRPDGLWPTLYLLHGHSGDHTDWLRKTSLERYVQESGLAVVMPSGHNSFYTDAPLGGRYFEHVSQEIPSLCEQLFPLSTKREDRFAAGLSMGGYGAFKLALRHPDRFAAGISLSGLMDMLGMMRADEHVTTGGLPFSGIFGPEAEERGGENDLMAVARRLLASGKPLPRLYAACGTEDFLYENNLRFMEALREPLGVVFEEGPGGHTWAFWDQYIQRAIRWLGFEVAG